MGHRTLVAYDRDGYDLHYAHWGVDPETLTPQTPFGGPPDEEWASDRADDLLAPAGGRLTESNDAAVETDPIATGLSFVELGSYVDPLEHEALFIVDEEFTIRTYLLFGLDGYNVGREGGPAIVLVGYDGEADAAYLRGWFAGARAVRCVCGPDDGAMVRALRWLDPERGTVVWLAGRERSERPDKAGPKSPPARATSGRTPQPSTSVNLTDAIFETVTEETTEPAGRSGSEIRTEPTIGAAESLVTDAIAREALVTLFGRCKVEYNGRSTSELGPGDRHLMLKPDGTHLVHAEEGQKPVNWQTPGSEHSCRIEDGALVIESARTTPKERLVVTLSEIALVAAFDAEDDESIDRMGAESHLKRRILEAPHLIETGFTPLSTERETPAGAVDVYGEDEDGRTVVLELKRRRVGPNAVGQLNRYVEALERDLHADADIRGMLVAPSVTERAKALLAERGLEFVPLTPWED